MWNHTVPADAVIDRRPDGSATSYSIGDGVVWNDVTVPGSATAILRRGRMATRLAVVVQIIHGKLVIQVEQGSEAAFELRVNGQAKEFPATGVRSMAEQICRPNGE